MSSTDSRFSRLETDPRFRRPKQKKLKVEIDDRFKEIIQGDDFAQEGRGAAGRTSDKYGRPLAKTHHADQLKQFYRLRSPSPNAEGEEKDGSFVDYARGEGLLESSGSEDEDDEVEEEESDDEEIIEMGFKKKRSIPGQTAAEGESDEGSDDSDNEDNFHVDLSEGDEELEPRSAFPDEAETEAEAQEDDSEIIEPTRRFAVVNMDWDNMRAIDLYTVFSSVLSSAQQPQGSSKRRQEDSQPAPSGKLLKVTIYPSEFGKERMAKEEAEGPSAEVFAASSRPEFKGKGKQIELRPSRTLAKASRRAAAGQDDELEGSDAEAYSEGDIEEDLTDPELDDSDVESDGNEISEDEEADDDGVDDVLGKVRYDSEPDDDEESLAGEGGVDMDKLRNYQLERLRYYYAIVEFDDISAATYVFREVNGTEFERTANVFDISFVPEDMDFDEDCHDEATEVSKGYKGNDFVTDALRHSNVKLTWDQDDPNRTKVLRRTLTRTEIEEDDFKAYIASSSEDEEDEVVAKDGEDIEDAKAKRRKAKANAAKLREMLLNGGDGDENVWGKGDRGLPDMQDSHDKTDGDMEITFKAGLSATAVKDDDEENLTTLEKYQRRMKEKKDRKKEKRELKAGSRATDTDSKIVPPEEDDFFGGAEDDVPEPVSKPKRKDKKGTDNVSVPDAVTKSPKVKMANDLSASLASAVDEAKHFSMSDIVKAEKAEGKKKRKRTRKDKTEREVELGDAGFKVDVQDDRFKVLYDEPEFAIDPSNPHFIKTKNMTELLSEGTRRRKSKTSAPAEPLAASRQPESEPKGQSLQDLVAKVKRDSDALDSNAQQGLKRKRRRH